MSCTPLFLHLAPDDKFIDRALGCFCSLGGVENKLFLSSQSWKMPRYVNWEVEGGIDELLARLALVKECVVILHSMFHTRLDEIASGIPASCRLVWLGWGGDYWPILSAGLGVPTLLPETRVLVRRLKGKRISPPAWVFAGWDGVRSVLQRFSTRRNECSLTLLHRRVDFFAPVIDAEFDLVIAGSRGGIQARPLAWRYPVPAPEFGELARRPPCLSEEEFVLLGNSATPTNNHIEMLRLLRAGDKYW